MNKFQTSVPALSLALSAAVYSLLATSATAAEPACESCPPMAVIPAGTFQMGKTVNYGYGDMDGPTHEVRIAQPFELAVHEVTLGEFRSFVKDTGYLSRGKCNVYENGSDWFIHPERNWENPGFKQEENHPVVCVSWRDTQAYIDWLNGKTGRYYRLPSEAEWEYVASTANLGKARSGGAITHDVANIGKVDCCGGKTGGKDVWIHTAPVGSFPADKYGVRDQRGNVWEWQDDCYHVDYVGAPVDGASRDSCPAPGFHVVRGGSYGDAAEFLSDRFRLRGPEDQGYFTVGFRVARTIPDTVGKPVSDMFAAIRKRDASAVAATLASTSVPEIVYYWGETVRGKDAIAQWHREWFAEQGWVLAPEIAGRSLRDDRVATLTYTVEYIKNPQRKFEILMDCTLVREGNEWKVARIQQTLLKGPEGEG